MTKFEFFSDVDRNGVSTTYLVRYIWGRYPPYSVPYPVRVLNVCTYVLCVLVSIVFSTTMKLHERDSIPFCQHGIDFMHFATCSPTDVGMNKDSVYLLRSVGCCVTFYIEAQSN